MMASATSSQQRCVTERSKRGDHELEAVGKLLKYVQQNENNLQEIADWKGLKNDTLSEFSDHPKVHSLLRYCVAEYLTHRAAAITATSCNGKSSDDSEIRVLHIRAHEDEASPKNDNDGGESKAGSDSDCPPSSHEDFRKARYTTTLENNFYFFDLGKFRAKCGNDDPSSSHSESQKEGYDTTSTQNFDKTEFLDKPKAYSLLLDCLAEFLTHTSAAISTTTCNTKSSNDSEFRVLPIRAHEDQSSPTNDIDCGQFHAKSDSDCPPSSQEDFCKTHFNSTLENDDYLVGQNDGMEKRKSIIFNDMGHCNANHLLQMLLFNNAELSSVIPGRSYFVWVVQQGDITLEDLMRNLSLLSSRTRDHVMQSEALRYRSFEHLSQDWRRRCNIDSGVSISDAVSLGFYFLGMEDEIHCCFCGLTGRLSAGPSQWRHQCLASPMLDGTALIPRTALQNASAVGVATASGPSTAESIRVTMPVEAVDYESPPVSPTSVGASLQRDLSMGIRGQQYAAGNEQTSLPLQSMLHARDSEPSFWSNVVSFSNVGYHNVMTPALQNVIDSENRQNRGVQNLVDDDNRPATVDDMASSAIQCQDQPSSSDSDDEA